MNAKEQFLVFGLNGNRFAISLNFVQRVVRVVEITPVPEPPAGIRGVINVEGQIIPVIDLGINFISPKLKSWYRIT